MVFTANLCQQLVRLQPYRVTPVRAPVALTSTTTELLQRRERAREVIGRADALALC